MAVVQHLHKASNCNTSLFFRYDEREIGANALYLVCDRRETLAIAGAATGLVPGWCQENYGQVTTH